MYEKLALFSQNKDFASYDEMLEMNEQIRELLNEFRIKNSLEEQVLFLEKQLLNLKQELKKDIQQVREDTPSLTELIKMVKGPKGEKGDKGDKPIKGIDFMTQRDVEVFRQEATPIKGENYFTQEEINEFLKVVTPVKGTDYLTEEEVEDIKNEITPLKDIDFRDGKDGEKGEIGPMPKHEWQGTKLRFEISTGKWGKWIELKGKEGMMGSNKTSFLIGKASTFVRATHTGVLPSAASIYFSGTNVVGNRISLFIATGEQTVDQINVISRVASGASKTDTYTVYKNGSATSMTVSITNATSGSSAVSPIQLATGDSVEILVTTATDTLVEDVCVQLKIT